MLVAMVNLNLKNKSNRKFLGCISDEMQPKFFFKFRVQMNVKVIIIDLWLPWC
jgi:hypothetical protein